MHISEGLLPPAWAASWFGAAAPFLYAGLRRIERRWREDPSYKPMVGLMGAAVFVISLLPIPVPIVGTCSHPCGTPLAAILLGPLASSVLASVALLLQALFLAHGGLSTWGANILSMGVVGSFVGYGAWRLSRRIGGSLFISAFVAGLLGDWATYAATALILALGIHGGHPPVGAFFTILLAFAPTQIPLGALEGILYGLMVRYLERARPELLQRFGLVEVEG